MKPTKPMAVVLLVLFGFMPKTVQNAAAQTPSPTPATQPPNIQPAAFQMGSTPALPKVIALEGNLEETSLTTNSRWGHQFDFVRGLRPAL